MEQLNKVTLCGRVGNIKVSEVGNTKIARLTLATNEVYRDKNSGIVMETTWHNVTAWKGNDIVDFDELHKGDAVYVEGRLKMTKYCGTDGVERSTYEVISNKMNKVAE